MVLFFNFTFFVFLFYLTLLTFSKTFCRAVIFVGRMVLGGGGVVWVGLGGGGGVVFIL